MNYREAMELVSRHTRIWELAGDDGQADVREARVDPEHAGIEHLFAESRRRLRPGQRPASPAAVATGFVYTAATVLDWQAVQVWRIEWLLGAIAMFAAGVLLKRRRS